MDPAPDRWYRNRLSSVGSTFMDFSKFLPSDPTLLSSYPLEPKLAERLDATLRKETLDLFKTRYRELALSTESRDPLMVCRVLIDLLAVELNVLAANVGAYWELEDRPQFEGVPFDHWVTMVVKEVLLVAKEQQATGKPKRYR